MQSAAAMQLSRHSITRPLALVPVLWQKKSFVAVLPTAVHPMAAVQKAGGKVRQPWLTQYEYGYRPVAATHVHVDQYAWQLA